MDPLRRLVTVGSTAIDVTATSSTCWPTWRRHPAKLLEKAFGSQFEDTDEMFVEHTEA